SWRGAQAPRDPRRRGHRLGAGGWRGCRGGRGRGGGRGAVAGVCARALGAWATAGTLEAFLVARRHACSASYDLIRGTFAVGCTPGAAAVAAVDQYRVEGVSSGTPLVFSAELAVTLRAFPFNCYQAGSPQPTASASARLREGDS